MKIEPEAGSLIGPSVSPAQLKLGTIQWVFFGRESSVVMSSSYFAHYISIVLVPLHYYFMLPQVNLKGLNRTEHSKSRRRLRFCCGLIGWPCVNSVALSVIQKTSFTSHGSAMVCLCGKKKQKKKKACGRKATWSPLSS